VEVRRLLDRGRRVVGQARVDLDRDVAVATACPVPDGSEKIAGGGDITHRQLQEDAPGIRIAAGDLLVVGVPMRERLLEDARIRGDADDGVLVDRLRKGAGFDQITRQIVDPDALAERRQLMQARAHCLKDRSHVSTAPSGLGLTSMVDEGLALARDEALTRWLANIADSSGSTRDRRPPAAR
jgi:hypothetical protein